jgi:Protein of unknown function (DUF1329)
MRFTTRIITAALMAACAGATYGASPEEAKQLGTTLTAVGAEKAGNKEGTIPAYTGGLTSPPASYEKGSKLRPDPFATEKPRLVITGKDAAAHADKLTEGTKELLKRYPTMRLDVYPTHRTVSVPQRVLDNTLKNATGAKAAEGGLALENVLPGYPFPIPKTGAEAMWNHLLRYNGLGYDGPRYENWNVDAAGAPTLAVQADAFWAWPIYDPKKTGPISASDPYWYNKLHYVGPARRNGEALLIIDSVNPLKQPRRAWLYLPGQRRTKLAPDLAYDTPNPGAAGAATYDDVSVFNGALDRYDWKLVGKKEMYVPYSNYRLTYHKNAADITKPNHLNPDLVRWELHRVWVVEAALKADKRHIYSKRVFYLDEDSWNALASDQYDARGQLFRSSFAFQSQSYDVQAPFGDTFAIYDFNSGVYNISGLFGTYGGLKYMTELPRDSAWTAEALAGAGVR